MPNAECFTQNLQQSLQWTYSLMSAHVPEPPDQDPNIPTDRPPEVPPPTEPSDDEVDLPPREAPEEIRDPTKPPQQNPPMRTH